MWLDRFDDADGDHRRFGPRFGHGFGRGFGRSQRNPWGGWFASAEIAAEPSPFALTAAMSDPLAGIQTVSTPEPSTFVLAAVAAMGFVVLGWRKRRR